MKNLKLLSAIFLLGLSINVFADKRFSCDTFNLRNAEPLIEDMVDRIQTVANIKQRYHVCRKDKFSNASATIINRKRLIIYDPVFLDELSRASDEQYWGRLTALAHEIGHHFHGHSDRLRVNSRLPELKRLKLSRLYELQADEFAGKVLAGLGASLNNTQALIKLLKTHVAEKYSAHPKSKKRVDAVTRGWNIGCHKAGANCNSPRYKRRISNNKSQSPLGRKATSGYTPFLQLAEQLKGQKVNQRYCNLYARLAAEQTKRSRQYKCGFNIGGKNSQWSTAFAPQVNWCMGASAYATSKEARFRETKLASCIR